MMHSENCVLTFEASFWWYQVLSCMAVCLNNPVYTWTRGSELSVGMRLVASPPSAAGFLLGKDALVLTFLKLLNLSDSLEILKSVSSRK